MLGYIDSVYTKLRSGSLQAYGKVHVQTYECRLRKSKKSQTARGATASDSKIIKRRCSSIRDSYLCNVRIKVSRFVDNTAVIVERHDIEESFRIQKGETSSNSSTVIFTGLLRWNNKSRYCKASVETAS